jgi:hypothetical protein
LGPTRFSFSFIVDHVDVVARPRPRGKLARSRAAWSNVRNCISARLRYLAWDAMLLNINRYRILRR